MLRKKSFNNALALSVALATAAIALPFKANALTFDFEFDTTFDGTVTPPIVGTGTFSFDGDPGDGAVALTSLSNFDFSFTIAGNTFTTANILTPLANIAVQISTIGSDRFVNFGGSGGGPNGGSIDFNNGSAILTLQPGFGPLYQATGAAGTYQGIAAAPTSTPEPATVLGLLSIAGVGLLSKRQKQ